MPGSDSKRRSARAAPVQAVPNVVLRTHDGKRVRLDDDLIKGRFALINFFYTRCTGVCGMATAKLRQVQDAFGERLGRDVVMISVTIDPEGDTPAVLQDYATRHGIRAGWFLVTGERGQITLLRDRLGLRDPGDTATHTQLVVYGNAATGQWAATPVLANPQSLLRNVNRLMNLAKRRTG